MASWEIGRGARRHAGPLLLLVMAFAMVVFALCYGMTWQVSQADQADFAVGADVRVVGSTLPPLAQAGTVAAGPLVSGAAPVVRTGAAAGDLRSVALLAVDSRSFGDVLLLRPDLGAPADQTPATKQSTGQATGQASRQSPQTLAALLAVGRPRDASVAVPGQPKTVEVTVRATVQSGPAVAAGTLKLTVEDASDQTGTLTADLIPDGKEHTVRWNLDALTGAGGRFAWPLRIVGVGYSVAAPALTHHDPVPVEVVPGAPPPAAPTNPDGTMRQPQDPAVIAVDLIHLRTGASTDPAAPLDELPALPLAAVRLGVATSVSTASDQMPVKPALSGPATVPPGELLRFTFSSGLGVAGGSQAATSATGSATLAGPAPEELRAVASDAFLAETGRAVGDSVSVTTNGASVTVRIAGSVRRLPTTKPGDAGLVVDDATLLAILAERSPSGVFTLPREWWVRATPGAAAQAATGLRETMGASAVLDRTSARSALLSDPLQDGLRGALVIAAIAATSIAAVGFALYSLSAVRERTAQTAILRALGVTRRQLGVVLTTEQTYVVGVGGLAGTGLGLLLARMLVPRIALSRDGTAPSVPVLVHVPWLTLAALGLGVFVVFGAVTAVVVAIAQRSGLVSALRLGEER